MAKGPLIKRVSIKRQGANIAAGTTTQTFTTQSMVQDGVAYQGVLCLVHLGDITATAAGHLRAYQGKNSGGSDKALLAGTSALAAAGASDQDDLMLQLDVYKPMEPYVTFELVRGVANMEVDAVTYIFYDPREEPVAQGSTVLSSVALVEPDEA